MKAKSIAFIFILFTFTATAQVDKTKTNPYDVNVSTSQIDASYPGGSDSLMNFIWKNLKYPATAQQNNVQGEVQISFDVNFDGNLINFSKISNLGYGLEEELIRVVKLTPKWIPAEINKMKVRQQYLLTFPISRYNTK